MSQYNIWNNQQNNNLNHPNHSQQPLSPPQQQLSPDLLISKLNNLTSSQNYNNFLSSLNNNGANTNSNHPQHQFNHQFSDQNNYSFNSYSNDFNLPLELQGGLSNIQSRRPSYTADQITYNHSNNNSGNGNNNNKFNSLESYVHHNNFNNNMGVNFRSRRPSIQIQSNQTISQHVPNSAPQFSNSGNSNGSTNQIMELENGLLLQNGFIITSTSLQETYYEQTKTYFCADDALKLYEKLQYHVLSNEVIQKVIINLKKLNNLFNLIKPLTLILTKSGKFEILSTPLNSNLKIVNNDVVISDGDRGKDLVYVLEANLGLEMAILINYLKKKQHARAISYTQVQQSHLNEISTISNTVEDLLSGKGILDEETQFQIPSKQILRFATPSEITNLKFKLVEEIKSYKTAVLKINQNQDLRNSLEILTSEYQFDQKKLTFYYRSLERLDFRSLIKELFKIYKTRIWLCAVVNVDGNVIRPKVIDNYDLINDDVDLRSYKNDSFHVRIFDKLFDELLAL